MYSPKTTKATLEQFAKDEGWMPVPHTIEEVDEFKAYVESIVEIESNSQNSYVSISKPISAVRQKEITRWVENEQITCAADYSYWESRYAYVKSETGEVVRFKNRYAQTILDSVIADLEEKNLAKEIILLGSRQLGAGTKFILMCIHRALFSPNSGVLLTSSQRIKSEFMVTIADTAFNFCPWWLVPLKSPKGKLENGSVMSIKAGAKAQGWTPNYVYIADAESYYNPVMTIEEGLLRAIHSSANNLLVIHGQRPKDHGWLRNIWNYSKEYYPKGQARFMPVFLPWYVSSDIYPTKEWIARFPVPEKWVPAKETKDHALRSELYVRSTPLLSKALGKGWKMPTEQKWYWEYSYNYARAIDALDNFLSYMGADDSEQLDNTPVAEEDIDIGNLFPSASKSQKKLNKAV